MPWPGMSPRAFLEFCSLHSGAEPTGHKHLGMRLRLHREHGFLCSERKETLASSVTEPLGQDLL